MSSNAHLGSLSAVHARVAAPSPVEGRARGRRESGRAINRLWRAAPFPMAASKRGAGRFRYRAPPGERAVTAPGCNVLARFAHAIRVAGASVDRGRARSARKNSQATGRGRCTRGLGFDLLLRIKAAVRADVATPGGALLPRSLDPPRRCPTLGNSAESQTAATRCRAAEWPGNFSFMIRAEPGSRKNWPSAVSIVRDVVKARGVGGGSSRPSPVTRAPLVQSSEGGPGNSAERGHESLRRRSEELATARRWPRRRQKTKRGKRKTGRGAWGFPGLGSAFGPTRRRRARPVPATSCPFSPVQLSSFTIAGVLRV